LGTLAGDERVTFVVPPEKLRPDVISEGVDNVGANRLGATGAKAWQDGGRDGTGVKVAIVDVGFSGYQAEQSQGRLPSNITTRNFCGNGNTGFDGSGPTGSNQQVDHGTAVAEIVHQMAPAATLYLVCIFYSSSAGQAEQYLASQGVTVVNASIGDVLDGRGDGSGPANSLAGAVAAGRQAGQLWSVSAGNDAQKHFNFTGKDVDGDGRVEMLPGASVFATADPSEGYSFTLASGRSSSVQMKWDAWPTTTDGSTICFAQDTVVAPPTCGQNTYSFPGRPVQQATFTNSTGSSHTYYVVIQRTAGTTNNLRFDVWFEGAETNLASVTGGSLTEPATSPNVMTMGAHHYSTGNRESFSSQGPTIDGRIKPDLSGPDGVSSDVIGSFFGTSAAAPHGTGAAALVKGALPSATPDQIKAVLLGRGVDAGAVGPDNQYGNGWLRMGAVTTSAASGPTEVLSNTGRTDAFVVGSDGGLWQRTATASGSTLWTPLGGFVTSDPDASSWGGGRLDVFARGGDNALWHRSSSDGTNWTSWESLGGVLTSGPSAVSTAPNKIDVFVRGGDGALWTMSTGNGVTWSGWSSLGGFLLGDPDAASWNANRVDLFVRGGDSALWHAWRDGSMWSAWQPLGGVLSSSPGAISSNVNRVEVGVRGTDNALWLLTWNGAAWSNWSSLGGGLLSAPDFSKSSSGIHAVVRGGDSAVWQQAFNGAWSGWASIGPP
jgi:hypothetical protein